MGTICPINLLRLIKQNKTAGFFFSLLSNTISFKKNNLITSYHKCTKRQISRFPTKLNDLKLYIYIFFKNKGIKNKNDSDYVTITRNIF